MLMFGRDQQNIVKQFSPNKKKRKKKGQFKKKKKKKKKKQKKKKKKTFSSQSLSEGSRHGKRPDHHLSGFPPANGHQAKDTLRAGKQDDSGSMCIGQ